MTMVVYVALNIGKDVAYRIPSTFVSAAVYGAAMVLSIPLLIEALVQIPRRGWQTWLLIAALGVSVVGVFMAASRSQALILGFLGLVLFLRGRLNGIHWLTVAVVAVTVGWVVMNNPRMQRFTSLQDTNYDQKRISKSVTPELLEHVMEQPMGYGLGSAGTSIPYFLQSELIDPIFVENEYGWIALEQGIPGLVMWIAFLSWLFASAYSRKGERWNSGRAMAWYACAAYFGTAFIGTGVFSRSR